MSNNSDEAKKVNNQQNGDSNENSENVSLVNGSNIQFEYNNKGQANAEASKSDSKKKKKKKKSKAKKNQESQVDESTIRELDFDDPDFEYPDSRILKQGANGDLIIQSYEPEQQGQNKSKNPDPKQQSKKNSVSSNGFIPENQDDLNEQLKEYWASLSPDEKKKLLNLERDSVFKVMKEQQKITCNCSVCGRKRQIIEQELKKLYDNYFDGIDTQELIAAELFNINNQQSFKKQSLSQQNHDTSPQSQQQAQQQQQIQQQEQQLHQMKQIQQQQVQQLQQNEQKQQQLLQEQQRRSRKGFGTNNDQQVQQQPKSQQHPNQSSDLQRRNGIMSVAEDLLQNDGKKFLEMMEKLAESRIQRQNQYLRRNDLVNSSSQNATNNQIEEEEEEEPEYYDDDEDDEEEFGDEGEDEEDYDEDDDEEEFEDGHEYHHNHTHSHGHEHQGHGPHNHKHEHDHNHTHTHNHNHNHELEEELEEDDEFNSDDELNRRNMIQLQLQRQRQLQKQLQHERDELASLQDNYVDEGVPANREAHARAQAHAQAQIQAQQQQLQQQQKLLNQHGVHHQQQHQHQEGGELDAEEDDEEFDEDIEDEEDYSDDAIDEEQQLEEGRAMLQLCTTKMLRQSLLESYKTKKQEEYVKSLLDELEEENKLKAFKELKKQREKEKKREKKRLIQQQKEEERLRKEAEAERLKNEKEAENKRKIEEGRKRKQEEEKRIKEEKRRKEAERREKEERKKQQLEAKKKKELEDKKKLEEEQLQQQRIKEEEERLRREAFEAEERRQMDILRLQREQEELKRKEQEEEELRRQQQEAFSRQQQAQAQQDRSNSTNSIPDHFPEQFTQQQIPTANSLLDNLYQQSSAPFASPIGGSLSRHTQHVPQSHHIHQQQHHPRNDTPPGFQLAPGSKTLGSTQGLEPQISQLSNPGNSVFGSTRNFPDSNVSVRSPWNTNGVSKNSSTTKLFNPLDKSFNLFSQQNSQPTSQPQSQSSTQKQTTTLLNENSIDLLSNSLASTTFEPSNGNSNNFISSFLTGSQVWSTPTPSANGGMNGGNFNIGLNGGLNNGLNGGLNGSTTANAWPTTSADGGLWGTPSHSHTSPQASQLPSNTGFNGFLSGQQPPQSVGSVTTHPPPPSSGNVDQLIRNYQSQIYQAYTYLRSSFLEGGFILIEALFTTFNSLQPPNSALNFPLFLTVIHTKTSLYNFETIGDEVGNITHVKITPYQSNQLNQQQQPPVAPSSFSRSGSLPFNQFSVGGSDAIYGDPRRNTSFDVNNGSIWGSSLI